MPLGYRRKKLFRRAIVHGGSATASWAVAKGHRAYTAAVADRLNCTAGDAGSSLAASRLIVHCLRQVAAAELVQAAAAVASPPVKYLSAFGPTVAADNEVLPASSVEELMNNDCRLGNDTGSVLAHMELLLGVLGNEGCRYFTQSDIDAATTKSPASHADDIDDDARWRRTLRTYVRNNFRFHQQTIYDIVDHNYRDWDEESTSALSGDDDERSGSDAISRRRLVALADLITDGQYIAPTVDLATRHAVCGQYPADTFFYSFGLAPETDCGGRRQAKVDRRRHPDLLAYVFGAPLAEGLDPFSPTVVDEVGDERKTAETVMSYWANFIRTGNPSSPERDISAVRHVAVQWPAYDVNKQQYLIIGPRPRVRRRLKSRKMALWRDLIPRLHRADDFDLRLHLLDDYHNNETFEESGTLLVPPSDFNTKPSTPPTTDPPVLQSDVATSSGKNAGGGRTSTTVRTVAAESSPPNSTPALHSGELAASNHNEEDDDGHSTLFKTAAVGCSLLALNVVVFTAVMCQWRGLRRTRLIELQKYGGGGGSTGIVLGVPCPSTAAGDHVMDTYSGSATVNYEPTPPSPTVLTSAECTCNNIGMDGGPGLSGIVLTTPNNYYTYSSTANHVADYVNQRTTSTV